MNLSDYKTRFRQVSLVHGVVILSNGSKAKIGSMTAGFEAFRRMENRLMTRRNPASSAWTR